MSLHVVPAVHSAGVLWIGLGGFVGSATISAKHLEGEPRCPGLSARSPAALSACAAARLGAPWRHGRPCSRCAPTPPQGQRLLAAGRCGIQRSAVKAFASSALWAAFCGFIGTARQRERPLSSGWWQHRCRGSAAAGISLRAASNSAIFEVPVKARRDGLGTPGIDWNAVEEPAGFAYYGLAGLFPEAPGLQEVFNGNAAFRRRLREAMRSDLFRPVPHLKQEVNDELRALWMDLGKPHVKAPLVQAVEEGGYRLRLLPRLTEALDAHGLALTGAAFIERLLRLGKLVHSGRFSDLVGKPHEGHRWHQDHGEDQYTVMLGFPIEDGFEGEGVFSHVIRLSHPLRRPDSKNGWTEGTPIPVKFPGPEACIIRPVYRAGQEVMVYRDSGCLHSTPDVVQREALWRFM